MFLCGLGEENEERESKTARKVAQTETLTTQATANQIIFHTFWEKSRGLHTQLATVNHRRPSPIFTKGGGDGSRGGGGGGLVC